MIKCQKGLVSRQNLMRQDIVLNDTFRTNPKLLIRIVKHHSRENKSDSIS